MGHVHPLIAFRRNQNPPLSQKDLAAFLGVVRETVARWESGTRKIDDELLLEVSKKTGIAAGKLRPDLAQLLRRPERAA